MRQGRADTTAPTRVLRFIWTAQLVTLFLFGGVALFRELRTISPPVSGPWATTDRRLQHLELSRPSETIRSAMDGIGPGALQFLGRDGEPTILTYYTVSYLLWPRPVGLCLSRADAVTPHAIVRTQSAPVAVMYYTVDPPAAGPPPTMVGRYLALVAVSEREPWTTHCR